MLIHIVNWVINAIAVVAVFGFLADAIVHFIKGKDAKAIRSLMIMLLIVVFDVIMIWVLRL